MEFERNEITPEELKRLKEVVKRQKEILKELRKTIKEAEDELGKEDK